MATGGTRRPTIVLVAALALVALVGCAPAAPTGPAQDVTLLTPADIPEAWAEALEDAPGQLPDGHSWPQDPPAYMLEEGSRTAEDLPAMVLSDYWLCLWEIEYVDAVSAGDETRAGSSLDAMTTYASLPVVQRNFIDLQAWYTAVVERAIDGDPTGVESDVVACRPNLKVS